MSVDTDRPHVAASRGISALRGARPAFIVSNRCLVTFSALLPIAMGPYPGTEWNPDSESLALLFVCIVNHDVREFSLRGAKRCL